MVLFEDGVAYKFGPYCGTTGRGCGPFKRTSLVGGHYVARDRASEGINRVPMGPQSLSGFLSNLVITPSHICSYNYIVIHHSALSRWLSDMGVKAPWISWVEGLEWAHTTWAEDFFTLSWNFDVMWEAEQPHCVHEARSSQLEITEQKETEGLIASQSYGTIPGKLILAFLVW
jgi:hypothetical protein